MTVLNTFTLNGSFLIEASADGVSIYAQAQMQMGPLGDISAYGTLDINQSGVVAALSLASNISLGGFATLQAAATLEVNSTGVDQTVKEYTFDYGSGAISSTPVDVVIPGATLVRVNAVGRLELAGFFNLDGAFFLTLSQNELDVGVYAHLDAFFGLSLSVVGSAAISFENGNLGFVMAIQVSTSTDIASIVSISGAVTVEVNTFSTAKTLADPNPSHPAGSTITVANGAYIDLQADISLLSILHFHADGSITYDNVTNVFTLVLDVNESINLFIFSQQFEVGGWVNSTGQFAVTVYGHFEFGIGGIADIHGDGHLSMAYMVGHPTLAGSDYLPIHQDPNGHWLANDNLVQSGNRILTIEGGASLTGSLFGIDIGSVSLDFLVDSNLDLYFDVSVSINFFFFSITVSFRVDVGQIGGNKPPEVYLAGTQSNPQVSPGDFTGGVLVLNTGLLASNRNYQDANTDESVILQGGNDYNASAGTQTIYVTLLGYTQAFRNVSKVVIPGDGNDNIRVNNTVHVPVYATVGGAGKSGIIIDGGSGNDLLVGGAGNDIIQAGSGADTISGNGGSDTLTAGTGPDTISTTGPGPGNSTIIWNPDLDSNVTLSGAGGTDELVATANTPGTPYSGGEKLGLTAAAGGGAQLIHTLNDNTTRGIYFTNVPNVLISAPGGANTVHVGNLLNTGVTHLTLSYGSSHSGANGLSLDGSSGADVYTINASQGALPTVPSPTIPTPYAAPAAQPSAVSTARPFAAPNSVETLEVNQAGGVDLQIFGVSNPSGDSLAINSAGGSDTYYISSLNIPTTLQGNTAQTPATTPYTTTYYVGWQGAGVPSTLSGIAALLSVVGDKGTDIIVLQDASDAADRSFTLTSTAVLTDALGTGGKIAYDGAIDNLDIQAGPGNNSYLVKGTAASTQTQIQADNSDNHFVINAPITAPLAINGGSAVFGSQTLTVNGDSNNDNFVIGPNLITGAGAPIFYTNVQGITVAATSGTNSFILNGNTVPTTLLGGSGNDTFTVNGTSQPTTIDGGTGSDTFTVNGNGAPLVVSGEGNDTFIVNGNSSQTTLNGGSGANWFNVNSNTNALSLNGGSGKNAFNTFNILGNSSTLNINTNTGASAFNIANIVSPVTINGQATSAAYHITGPLYAPVNVVGGSVIQSLVVDATAGNDNLIITPTSITGLGAPINYSGLLSVTINGDGGDDTFTLNGNSAPTIINAGLGNSLFNVQAVSFPLALITGNGASTVNLGSPQGNAGGLLSGIAADVSITGSGNDALNVDDSADGIGQAGALTPTTISGAGIDGATVNYSGISLLNLALGSGADTFTIASTAALTPVNLSTGSGADVVNIEAANSALNVNTGDGANTINLGSLAPLAGGVLAKIQAPITLAGTGNDTLNLDDSGDVNTASADLTAGTFTGLGMIAAGLSYTGVLGVNLALGTGGNTLLIESTAARSNTVITGGSGGDVYNLRSDGGMVALHTGAGTNVTNVGSLVPAIGGVLSGIAGGFSISAGGVDTLNLDDSADVSNASLTLTSATLTGVNLGPAGIGYTGLTHLNLLLGSGNITATVNGTEPSATTTLTTGDGNNTINVLATGSGATSIQTGVGNDTFNVQSTGGPTSLRAGTGTNTFNVGTLAPATGGTLAGINAALTLAGGGSDTINLDDSAANTTQSGTLSATTLTGFSPAAINFGSDTGLAALDLSLGNSGNHLLITGTPSTAATNINTGAGNDAVTIQNAGGPTNLNTDDGNDTINVQATSGATTIQTGPGNNTIRIASAGPATLDAIQGPLRAQWQPCRHPHARRQRQRHFPRWYAFGDCPKWHGHGRHKLSRLRRRQLIARRRRHVAYPCRHRDGRDHQHFRLRRQRCHHGGRRRGSHQCQHRCRQQHGRHRIGQRPNDSHGHNRRE